VDVVSRSIDGERILVPIRSHAADLESIFTLNDAAARIWELVDGTRSVDEIVETIHREYDVDRERAASDVESFLGQLEEARLVV
jgi:hypothetical protein